MITVKVYADEVLFRLDQIPKRLRAALQSKFESVFAEVTRQTFEGLPGKYLDPTTVQSGISQQGSLTIGFIESQDKPGLYLIYPTKARALRFIAKDGDLVYTKRVLHPFLKSSTTVERSIAALKPWIEDQLEDALIEAL